MSLDIQEQKNKKLKIVNTANNLDKEIAPELPDPLPKYSGFNFVVSGPSGSGKTTLLTSLMTARKKNGIPQSYRRCFDKILICSPTLGQGKSQKKDPFADVNGNQKWKEFNNQSMDEMYEKAHDEAKNDVEGYDGAAFKKQVSEKTEEIIQMVELTQMTNRKKNPH